MKLTEKQRELIKAIAEAKERDLANYRKSARILAVAAKPLGILTAEAERRLFSELEPNLSPVDELYSELIALVQVGEFVVGHGNFGEDLHSAANPLFSECRLTEKGIEVARTLR